MKGFFGAFACLFQSEKQAFGIRLLATYSMITDKDVDRPALPLCNCLRYHIRAARYDGQLLSGIVQIAQKRTNTGIGLQLA